MKSAIKNKCALGISCLVLFLSAALLLFTGPALQTDIWNGMPVQTVSGGSAFTAWILADEEMPSNRLLPLQSLFSQAGGTVCTIYPDSVHNTLPELPAAGPRLILGLGSQWKTALDTAQRQNVQGVLLLFPTGTLQAVPYTCLLYTSDAPAIFHGQSQMWLPQFHCGFAQLLRQSLPFHPYRLQ